MHLPDVAAARTRVVLQHPGGPYRRTPLGRLSPRRANDSGCCLDITYFLRIIQKKISDALFAQAPRGLLLYPTWLSYLALYPCIACFALCIPAQASRMVRVFAFRIVFPGQACISRVPLMFLAGRAAFMPTLRLLLAYGLPPPLTKKSASYIPIF